MARIWTEGFSVMPSSKPDQYFDYVFTKAGTSSWAYATSISGRKNGLAVNFYTAGSNVISCFEKSIPPLKELYFRCWLNVNKLSGYDFKLELNDTILVFKNGSTYLFYAKMYMLENYTSNTTLSKYKIVFYDNNYNNIGESRILETETWQKIDVKFKVETNLNSVIVKVNDKTEINVTYNGTDLPVNVVSFGMCSGSLNSYTKYGFDDMALNDTSGTVNNSWCGNGHCETLVPIANGSTIQFTPSTGSNYTCVDEVIANTSDYNTTTTDGSIDIFSMTKLSTKGYTTDTKINGFNVYLNAKYTESPLDISNCMKINGTDYEENKNTLTSTFTSFRNSYIENPLTLTQLTVADIDNSEFGYKAKGVV